MVFNSPVLVWVVRRSARACQMISCNPEHLRDEQVLHLLCCVPCDLVRRVVVSFWTFFCAWHPEFYMDTDDDEFYSSDDDDSYETDSHSD